MTESWPPVITNAVAAAPTGLDLRDAVHLNLARTTADSFLSACPSMAELGRLEAFDCPRADRVDRLRGRFDDPRVRSLPGDAEEHRGHVPAVPAE